MANASPQPRTDPGEKATRSSRAAGRLPERNLSPDQQLHAQRLNDRSRMNRLRSSSTTAGPAEQRAAPGDAPESGTPSSPEADARTRRPGAGSPQQDPALQEQEQPQEQEAEAAEQQDAAQQEQAVQLAGLAQQAQAAEQEASRAETILRFLKKAQGGIRIFNLGSIASFWGALIGIGNMNMQLIWGNWTHQAVITKYPPLTKKELWLVAALDLVIVPLIFSIFILIALILYPCPFLDFLPSLGLLDLLKPIIKIVCTATGNT